MTGIFARGAVQDRRATARVAPTKALQGVRWGGRTGASAPTESLIAGEGGTMWASSPTKVFQEVRCGTESPSHGFAVTAPFRQGGRGDGGTDCHSQCAHWLRNDMVFHGARGKAGRRGGDTLPYEGKRKAGETGRRGRRPLRKCILRCVGEGLCPSRGRPRGSPLRRVTEVRWGGASGKSAKRRQWRKKRADFEEVPRLAGTTVAGNRLA